MKTNFLFPHTLKKVGWFVFVPTFIIGLASLLLEWEPDIFNCMVPSFFDNSFMDGKPTSGMVSMVSNNIFNEILGILFIISGLLVAFSREKDEDEMTLKYRLNALVWATYWNYGILILCFIMFYDFNFLWVMIFNMFTLLILVIIRFHLALWKARKLLKHEE